MKGMLKDVMKYRLPILVGAGGIVAYSAFQRARAGGAPVVGGGGAQAVTAPGGAGAGLDTQQALAMQAAAYGAGGGLGLQGASLGLETAHRGLDLAGIAVMGAQALSGDVIGLATNLGQNLADVSQSAIGSLPSFAPVQGIAPQPTTQPAPAAQPTTQPPATPAAPAPVTVKSRVTEYLGRVSAGQVVYYTVNSAGALTGSRTASFTGGSNAPMQRRVDGGRLHWRTAAGGLKGWSLVPGRATFSIQRRYLDTMSDGTKRTGAWEYISNTGA